MNIQNKGKAFYKQQALELQEKDKPELIYTSGKNINIRGLPKTYRQAIAEDLKKQPLDVVENMTKSAGILPRIKLLIKRELKNRKTNNE